jgi:hypothetical protein
MPSLSPLWAAMIALFEIVLRSTVDARLPITYPARLIEDKGLDGPSPKKSSPYICPKNPFLFKSRVLIPINLKCRGS